ncbi:MAG: hypothetical protein HYY26_01815 [Acidobacteria bacterium]|nr:hypothetical protein [Acidobacteriota bacterium]
MPSRGWERRLAGILLVAALGVAAGAQAPPTAGGATLEFSVRATPTGGRPEKVMRQTFYLLRARVEEIEKQVRAEVAAPALEAFVEELDVSAELKAWMKRTEKVELQGQTFLDALTVDDVMTVPEFRQAYVARNLSMVGLGFPRRRAKLTDREKNPEKWEKDDKRYWEEVRSYLILHPESKQGMDDHLVETNPAAGWRARTYRYEQDVRQRTLQLIHARYLAGQAETDYDGMARIGGIAPGRYWLTNLWNEVRAGDMHLNWELPVELRAGQTVYLELNNANARWGPRP